MDVQSHPAWTLIVMDSQLFCEQVGQAGYATGLFGKHYNSGGMEKICPKPVGDGTLTVPEGWTEYLGACPDTCYVNCTYNKNGGAASYTDPQAAGGANYGTSVRCWWHPCTNSRTNFDVLLSLCLIIAL
jgi:hypothetical protein